jgi:hypothetical protein
VPTQSLTNGGDDASNDGERGRRLWFGEQDAAQCCDVDGLELAQGDLLAASLRLALRCATATRSPGPASPDALLRCPLRLFRYADPPPFELAPAQRHANAARLFYALNFCRAAASAGAAAALQANGDAASRLWAGVHQRLLDACCLERRLERYLRATPQFALPAVAGGRPLLAAAAKLGAARTTTAAAAAAAANDADVPQGAPLPLVGQLRDELRAFDADVTLLLASRQPTAPGVLIMLCDELRASVTLVGPTFGRAAARLTASANTLRRCVPAVAALPTHAARLHRQLCAATGDIELSSADSSLNHDDGDGDDAAGERANALLLPGGAPPLDLGDAVVEAHNAFGVVLRTLTGVFKTPAMRQDKTVSNRKQKHSPAPQKKIFLNN